MTTVASVRPHDQTAALPQRALTTRFADFWLLGGASLLATDFLGIAAAYR